MHSENESVESIQIYKPRNKAESNDIRNKHKQRAKRSNKISSPEIQSIASNSGTSDKTSIEMKQFEVQAHKSTISSTNKSLKKQKLTHATSEDISEISNSTSDLNSQTSDEAMFKSTSDRETSDYQTSKSYRDRLKDRFRNVKQQSSQSLSKSSLNKFKNRSQTIITLNKSIKNLKEENVKIDQHLKARKHYQYIGDGGDGEVSSAEKYQFFCESLPQSSTWKTKESAHVDRIQSEESREENEDLPKTIDVLEVKRAEDVRDQLNQSYEDLIWVPANKNQIFVAEVTSQNLLAEGLYVTKPPKMPKIHLYQLEQRLLASENKNWFDSSGQLKIAEANYSRKSYRPDGYADMNTIDVNYMKASRIVPTNMSSITVTKIQPTLDINIQNIRLSSHPLFSTEHILQEQLIYHFDQHKTFQRTNRREKLFDRLRTLRQTRQDLIAITHAAGDNNSNWQSEKTLLKQIKSAREDFYKECKLYRDNTKSILTAWKNLKKHREESAHSNTSIKLVINKQERQFFDELEDALNEIYKEKEDEYQVKIKLYKKELSEWRALAENDEDKPVKPPRNTSAKSIRSRVESAIEESFGVESEPTLSFSVNYSNIITNTNALNDNEEKKRRSAIGNTKIHLKLLLNDTEICKTKSTKLNDNFSLNFDECFSIKLMQEASEQELLKIQIIEQQSLSKKLLSTVTIEVPKQTQLISQSKFEEYSFEDEVTGKNKISGSLNFCVGWSDSDTQISRQDQKEKDNLLNSDGSLNAVKLKDWMETNKPDPQDPRNTILFDYLHDHPDPATNKTSTSKEYFRCDPYLEPFTISSLGQIEDNIRMQLLQLRASNEPEFVDMAVPNRLKEIPSNIFSTYKRRLADEKYQDYFDEEDALDDDIIAKRSLGRKYLKQIHTKVFQICRNSENNLSYEDIVNEKMIPWIQMCLKTCLANFLNWFKLQPSAISMKYPTPSIKHKELSVENVSSIKPMESVIIHLISGHNLPKPRRFAQEHKLSQKKTNKLRSTNSDQEQIQPGKYFIEIIYENTTIRSSMVDENNPKWNERFNLNILAANIDYLNPQSLSGYIDINLYQQIEYHGTTVDLWLANLEIPLAAAFSDYKLEGEFILKIPPVLFNYEKEQETYASTPRIQNLQTSKNLGFLNLSIHSEHTIPQISPDFSSFASSEPPYLKDHIIEWSKQFNLDQPKRNFNALVMDANGKTVCITRFIKILEPPQLNSDGFDITAEQCARFISLIPLTKANKLLQNVWLTAEQMMKLKCGSMVDHAVLLTCYLLSLNLEVWLVLGFGIPHGNTAYVLLREYNETPLPNHFVFDMITGLKFNVTDPLCPLKKIYCIVNEHNIWGNVQGGNAVATTRFDLTRRFDWRQLFNNQVPAPTSTLQQNLHYFNSGNLSNLEIAIEKKLRKKIAKLRKQDVTIWNHYASSLLKAQTHKAEKNFMHNKSYIALSNEIVEFSTNYLVNGFIQCLPFGSINEIVECVTKTKQHEFTATSVEFASSTRVEFYPNQVIAVWIAFAIIMKK